MTTPDRFEYVVVGGGSAGCVMASRLSEDPDVRVLLIEAGHAYPLDGVPEVFTDLSRVGGDAETDWGYTARTTAAGGELAVPRGRGLGGSSSINAAVALRARRSDVEGWRRHGVAEWPWEEVLAAYRAIERADSGSDEQHGRSGPIFVEQRTGRDLTPALDAFIEGGEQAGFAVVDDVNGERQEGVSAYALTKRGETRWSSALGWLPQSVRDRPNLVILGDTLVDRVLLEDGKARGVRTAGGDEYDADREVVLCGGTYGSALVLLRSGIGPRGDLEALGIPVVVDAPVGQHLQEQPFALVTYALRPGSTEMEPASGALVWTASSEAGADELDLHISATHLADPASSPTGGAIVFAASVVRPDSTGTIRLTSTDPAAPPAIDLGMLGTERDRSRIVEAVRLTRRIAMTDALQRVLDHELTPGAEVASDDAVLAHVEANVTTYNHVSASAPMGTDGHAVVDDWGRVRGARRLRVVDASILPAVPSSTTNLTVMMLAQRIAARMTSVLPADTGSPAR